MRHYYIDDREVIDISWDFDDDMAFVCEAYWNDNNEELSDDDMNKLTDLYPERGEEAYLDRCIMQAEYYNDGDR